MQIFAWGSVTEYVTYEHVGQHYQDNTGLNPLGSYYDLAAGHRRRDRRQLGSSTDRLKPDQSDRPDRGQRPFRRQHRAEQRQLRALDPRPRRQHSAQVQVLSIGAEFRQTAVKAVCRGIGPVKYLAARTHVWHDVECDGEPRLFAMKGQRAMPEIRRKQHQLAEFWTNRQLGIQRRRRDHPRRAKAQNPFGRASRSHAIGQLNITSRGYPSPRMHVAGVIAGAVQTYRPAAVES